MSVKKIRNLTQATIFEAVDLYQSFRGTQLKQTLASQFGRWLTENRQNLSAKLHNESDWRKSNWKIVRGGLGHFRNRVGEI